MSLLKRQSLKIKGNDMSVLGFDEDKKIYEDKHIQVFVMDEPSHGGACHEYIVANNQKDVVIDRIDFQKGPILEHGVNGTSNEALLAIVIHRLKCFQRGQFSCDENGKALFHVKEALRWLDIRTGSREKRGVEGTNQK